MAKRIASNTREKAHIELDKLSTGSVVLDRYGNAWQTDRLYWYRAYDGDTASSYELSYMHPFTVIHNGIRRSPR